MKITMYELLGMIKDGKAPKKIKYENREYYLYDNKSYLTTDKTRFLDNIYFTDLNIEVEIIEEEKKIPEKLTDILRVNDLEPPIDENMYKIWQQTIKNQNKINEIIDYLKSKGDE